MWLLDLKVWMQIAIWFLSISNHTKILPCTKSLFVFCEAFILWVICTTLRFYSIHFLHSIKVTIVFQIVSEYRGHFVRHNQKCNISDYTLATCCSQTGSWLVWIPAVTVGKPVHIEVMQHFFANMSFCPCKLSKCRLQSKCTACLSPEISSDSVEFTLLQGGWVIWLFPIWIFIFIAPWNWGFYMVCK